jgi:hypothetical protein
MNWALYAKWTNTKQHWRKARAKQIELLNDKDEGETSLQYIISKGFGLVRVNVLVSFCGSLFFLHLLQILFLQFTCLSSLNLSHWERCTICFLQVVFCKVLVIFSIANVDELESYIA